MDATTEIDVPLPQRLLAQVDRLAQQRNLTLPQLITLAVDEFVARQPPVPSHDSASPQADTAKEETDAAERSQAERRLIQQGDLYWLQVEETDYPHPHVVIQADVINQSRVKTVVVCALTSNLKRATEPGNLLLDAGEANLSRQSVVVISQVDAVDKTRLGAYIGSLSTRRVEQILTGMHFQQRTFFARYQAD